MNKMINFEAIENTDVKTSPYPYFSLENAIKVNHKQELLSDFPELLSGGSFPLDTLDIKGSLKSLVQDIKSSEFRQSLAKKFEVDLSDKPIVITARGYSRQRDGQNHTDSKTKLITVLLYFNEKWDEPNGRLRILNSNDINDYQEELSSSFGQMIAFKVTENCWHGYQPFEGKRQSLQINYLVDNKYNKHHVYRHKISAAFKKLFGSKA